VRINIARRLLLYNLFRSGPLIDIVVGSKAVAQAG